MDYFVYLLRCRDGSLYCGITSDLSRRLKEHNGFLSGGAKYTRGRRPVELVYSTKVFDYSSALKTEIRVKRLNRWEKLALISGKTNLLV